jgi:hypothetical protein
MVCAIPRSNQIKSMTINLITLHREMQTSHPPVPKVAFIETSIEEAS